MFLPFVLLLWLVLVMLMLAAFIDAVEECQDKGQRARRSATLQSSASAPVRPGRFHLLHHSH